MAKSIGWDSVPFILNQISWHLKGINDTLQTIADAEDSHEVVEFNRTRSLEKLKSLYATRCDNFTDQISQAVNDANNK